MQEFSSLTAEETLSALQSGERGLTGSEAAARLKKYGKNELRRKKSGGRSGFFLRSLPTL